jgi:hypothetical protein
MELNFENWTVEEIILKIASIAAMEGISIEEIRLKEEVYESLCNGMDYQPNSQIVFMGPMGSIKIHKL